MRSVVAKCNIKHGEIFTEDNITTMRPYLDNSISARKYYDVLGNTCKRNYNTKEILDKNELYE